jgi:hypothetical protein
MAATKDDFLVLLKLDEVYRPGVEARKFAYSDRLAEVVSAGTFFETYPLDSDERFWVNELATYYEMLATLWEEGVVDESLALDWAGAVFTWKLIGPILVQSRKVFDSERLWTGFEGLAEAQAEL